MTRSKSSKLAPRAMLEVTNVLKGSKGRSIMKSIHQLDYKVAVKDDQPGDVEAKKDWGVSVVEEEGISPALKKAMMEAVLSVDKVKLLATEERDEFFFIGFL